MPFSAASVGFYVPPEHTERALEPYAVRDRVWQHSIVEVRLTFNQVIRLHDQVVITFPSEFDISSVTEVLSLFKGEETLTEDSFYTWYNNKFVGR